MPAADYIVSDIEVFVMMKMFLKTNKKGKESKETRNRFYICGRVLKETQQRMQHGRFSHFSRLAQTEMSEYNGILCGGWGLYDAH